MSVTGIIAEFNPFHNGHKYLIEAVKARGDTVVCVIGDDFTQRGDVALLTKYARAEAALECGTDLCLLMPVSWSMSCANNFALGGVSILKNLGCVDNIAFGSECGDIDKIKRVSEALRNDSLAGILANELKGGVTFAAARQNAVFKLIGQDADILSSANDILATEYVNAAKQLNFNVKFIAIPRQGKEHDSNKSDGIYLSASAIRKQILSGKTDDIKKFVPPESYGIISREFSEGKIADIKNIESAIISYLRRMSVSDFSSLPEISEGIENRIFDAVKKSLTLTECEDNIKTKRYTLARIRRILLSAYLGIDMSLFGKEVPYIKILGFNAKGEQLLKSTVASVPLIFRGNDYKNLSGDAEICFGVQNRAADLYALATEKRQPSALEYTTKLIKK